MLAEKLSQWLSGQKKSEQNGEVVAAIQRLEKGRLPVTLEIEHTSLRFKTALMLRNNVVAAHKPAAMSRYMEFGSWVRFTLPWDEEMVLRMEIVRPHVNLNNGRTVFLCRLPSGFIGGARRKAPRYNTVQYNNIQLHIPALGAFKVLDLSSSGVKVHAGNAEKLFAGLKMEQGALLKLGGYSVALKRVGLTHARRSMAGLSIQPEEKGEEAMNRLIAYLESAAQPKARRG